MKKVIKIATWNVGQDMECKEINLSSYEYIIQQIKENNIDIISFQESMTESNHIPPLAKYISENSDLKYYKEFSLSPTDDNGNDRMGVAICSKFKITKNEKYLLENPHLTNGKFWSHDKGFNISTIDEINAVIIGGHCLPFHVFGETPLHFKSVYEKFENKILNVLDSNKNVILSGDFNYINVFELMPKLKERLILVYENQKTRRDKQFDHILITKDIKCNYYDIVNARFDHMLCIAELEIDNF